MIRDQEWYRKRSSKWYADHFATNAEIMECVGPSPEEPEDPKARVLKVPIIDGKWLDCGVGSVMKALKMHPDTRHLSSEAMTRVACSMLYRFGDKIQPSVETEYSSSVDFADDEIVEMAKMINPEATAKKEGMEESTSEPTSEPTTKIINPTTADAELAEAEGILLQPANLNAGNAGPLFVDSVTAGHFDNVFGGGRLCMGPMAPTPSVGPTLATLEPLVPVQDLESKGEQSL